VYVRIANFLAAEAGADAAGDVDGAAGDAGDVGDVAGADAQARSTNAIRSCFMPRFHLAAETTSIGLQLRSSIDVGHRSAIGVSQARGIADAIPDRRGSTSGLPDLDELANHHRQQVPVDQSGTPSDRYRTVLPSFWIARSAPGLPAVWVCHTAVPNAS
jgi:hypothetical protein